MKKQLWPHQERSYNELRRAFAEGHRRIMVQSPTGSGKTILANHIIEQAIGKGNPVFFTVPKIQLVDQTCQRFMSEGMRPGVDFGVRQADHPWTYLGCDLQICSLQTLRARNNRLKKGVVIVDEAHVNDTFLYDWMEECPDVTFIGLSATPWTRGLGKHWEKLVVGSTITELIDAGILCDFSVLAPSKPDLDKVKTSHGEYKTKELSATSRDPGLIASIVDTWLEKARFRPTLIFAVDRMHADTIRRKFEYAGIECGYVDAYTPRADREKIEDRFNKKDLPVVVNVGVLTTGTDWDVRCVVLARATKSESLFVQMVGRGLRTNEDGQDCLILDHADNHMRMGFVTDIHYDELDDGEPRQSQQSERRVHLPVPCRGCGTLMPKGSRRCESCGKERGLPLSEIEEQDGELVELKRSAWQRTKKNYSPEEKQEIWAQLAWIARSKGYSEGWIWHTIQKMCGSAPRNRDVLPEKPTPEVEQYVKYLQAKYRKEKKLKEKLQKENDSIMRVGI